MFDEDNLSVLSDHGEEVEDLSDDLYSPLREEAISAQRLMLMRNAAEYVAGRAESAVPDVTRKWTQEKMFKVSALFEWSSGEPIEIVTAMRAGRVRARVSAEMGLGKSTLLPFYVARQMDHRVLYVAPDVAAISQINKYVRSVGKGKFMRHWSTTVKEHVCCMTYSDFCARQAMSSRTGLMQHFETIIFDEAFMKTPSVMAALKIFAVVASPTVNLLLCSANIRTDAAGVTAMSKGSGSVRELREYVSPEQAMASGKLVGDYLVDRTMVILPNDERVADMVLYYESEGLDVKSLDSASSVQAVEEVEAWLQGDSVTPRVMIATYRFSVAFNFPVSYVIVWPKVSESYLLDGAVAWREVDMVRSMVNQSVSRAGRGIAEGGGGMIMGPVTEEEPDMCLMDKLVEFCYLFACNIRPLKSKYWEDCYKIFPEGLRAVSAQQIRKSNLHPYVAARYLGSDGLFASNYANALMLFSQMGNFLLASVDSEPVAKGEWVSVDLFESGGEARCLVPVKTNGELSIVLQAVSCFVEEKFSMLRWRTETGMPYYDHGDYPGEQTDTAGIVKRRLRRVRSFEKAAVVVQSPKVEEWSYAATKLNTDLGGAGSRRAVEIPRTRFEEAIVAMKGVLPSYVVPSSGINIVESRDGTVGTLELVSRDMVVESPGGSTICTMPARVCEKLNEGHVLTYDELVVLTDVFREYGNRVVASRLFDGYSTPWTSFLLTLHNEEVVSRVVHRGLSTAVYGLLGALYARYETELVATANSSHVLRKKFLKLFSFRPTAMQVVEAMHRGKFTEIAQSKSFIARVLQLKQWMDHAYVIAEKHCVYLPHFVTNAQRTLPIHAQTALGSVAYGNLFNNPVATVGNPMSAVYKPTKADYDEWR